jgi:hypothetical protein
MNAAVLLSWKVFKIRRYFELRLHFEQGTHGDLQEPQIIILRSPSKAFRNIAGNGDRGSPHLGGQSEDLFPGEATADAVISR